MRPMKRRNIQIKECDGVYPPREDSNLLIEAIHINKGERFLEIGTGTGILAVHAALEGAAVTATDIDESAINCAKRNAEENSVKIRLIKTDLFRGVEGVFDAVAFNPPYLPEGGGEYSLKGAIESPEGGSMLANRYLEGVSEVLDSGGRAYLLISSLTEPDFLEKWKKTLILERVSQSHIFFEDLFVSMVKLRKDL